MAILDEVKLALRIAATTTDFDTEITGLINAALADLHLAGLAAGDTTDPLIKQAVITYCKAGFGYDNPDADRLQRSYGLLKAHLTLADDYVTYSVTFTVTSGGLPVGDAYIYIDGVEDPLKTNSLGAAVYRTKEKNIDVGFTVSKSGYVSQTGSVYVDADKAVEVVLVAA
ncbi:head-tail connector protein [Pelotomaculum propionicicum]|uniref:head-tail connector protein n=1 Tax=Pelotomaculum propionicicum TaxID=258475 RepID=UPI003B79DEC1